MQQQKTIMMPYGHLELMFSSLTECLTNVRSIYLNRKHSLRETIAQRKSIYPYKDIPIDSASLLQEGNRVKLVSTLLRTIPPHLLLADMIGCIHLLSYENIRYIKEGDTATVINDGSNLVQMEEISDKWMFVPATIHTSQRSGKKYDITLCGYLPTIDNNVRAIYENYALLKALGIISYLERSSIVSFEPDAFITTFVSKLETDMPTFADIYKERHINANDESAWIIDAFSDYFAGFFMGTVMLPEKKFPLCFQIIMELMEEFVLAQRMVVTNN